MTEPIEDSNKSPKMTDDEFLELGHLWKNYVMISARRQKMVRIVHWVAVSALVVVALLIDDALAWHVVRTIAEIVYDAADNISDALGV